MAIIELSCNLNGGDAVTANENLTFKLYGSADSYITPIATFGSHLTDANVTVSGDTVVITNIDVGSETLFKISSLDEAGNESALSTAAELGGYEPEYQAVLDYATSTLGLTSGDLPSSGVQDLQNQLVSDLKTNGLWNDMTGFYVPIGGSNMAFSKINWANTSKYPVGGTDPTLSANSGWSFVTENSTYIDTGWSPIESVDNPNFSNTNNSMGMYYDSITPVEDKNFFACRDTRFDFKFSNSSYRQYNATSTVNAFTGLTETNTFIQLSAYAPTVQQVFANGAVIDTDSSNTFEPIDTYTNESFLIGTARHVSIGSISSRHSTFTTGLLFLANNHFKDDASTFNTIVQNYITAVKAIT